MTTATSIWDGSVASDKASDVPAPALEQWENVELEATASGGGVHLEHDDHVVEHDEDTDGMAISFIDEKDQGFFGPSANISFMRIILRSMAGAFSEYPPESPIMVNINPFHARTESTSQPPRIASSAANPTVLPPDDELERLIQEYFQNTGTLFPYIHEASFMETYRQVKQSGFIGVRRTWLALLNIMLAMATRADASRPDTSRTSADSELFFRRARELCGTQMLRGTTLETVQYLLLSTQYLQGTQRAVQTWTTHGLAVKAALSVGLHSQAASSHIEDPVECEMRKRTWYGCVVLDRSLSMTFGRPSAIPEDYVRLPLPTPLPISTGSDEEEDAAPVLFFTSTVTLYRILWKVMASVYGHNIEHEELPGAELITRIIQLEQDIDTWRATLPAPLSLRTSSSLSTLASTSSPKEQQDSGIEKLRIILTLRYLNTKLLLLRPILTNLLQTRFITTTSSLKAPPPSSSSTSMHHTYFTQSTFHAALELISLIHTTTTSPTLGRHMLGAWWFTLYYAFNASLAVFGILLLPERDDKGVLGFASAGYQEEGRAALGKAIEALKGLASENALVDRCVEHLRRLCQLIDNRGEFVLTPPLSISLYLHAVRLTLCLCVALMSSSSVVVPVLPGTAATVGATHTNTHLSGEQGDVGISGGMASEDNYVLGMPFSDYNTMFENEVGVGLFFKDDMQFLTDYTYQF